MEVKGVLTKLIMGFMSAHENVYMQSKSSLKIFLLLLVPFCEKIKKKASYFQ